MRGHAGRCHQALGRGNRNDVHAMPDTVGNPVRSGCYLVAARCHISPQIFLTTPLRRDIFPVSGSRAALRITVTELCHVAVTHRRRRRRSYNSYRNYTSVAPRRDRGQGPPRSRGGGCFPVNSRKRRRRRALPTKFRPGRTSGRACSQAHSSRPDAAAIWRSVGGAVAHWTGAPFFLPAALGGGHGVDAARVRNAPPLAACQDRARASAGHRSGHPLPIRAFGAGQPFGLQAHPHETKEPA